MEADGIFFILKIDSSSQKKTYMTRRDPSPAKSDSRMTVKLFPCSSLKIIETNKEDTSDYRGLPDTIEFTEEKDTFILKWFLTLFSKVKSTYAHLHIRTAICAAKLLEKGINVPSFSTH